jgi:hypothetical protein
MSWRGAEGFLLPEIALIASVLPLRQDIKLRKLKTIKTLYNSYFTTHNQ